MSQSDNLHSYKIEPRFALLCGFILLAVLYRILPHPPNFSPVAAMALFAGAKFARFPIALVMTFAMLLLSDLFLGFYDGMLFVYGGMLSICLIGLSLRKNISLLKFLGGTLGATFAFFLISNFGVWWMTDLYPNTASGLLACYLAAIPFMQHSLLSNLLFGVVLFGGLYLLESHYPRLRESNSKAH